jgi:hypothetical protein
MEQPAPVRVDDTAKVHESRESCNYEILYARLLQSVVNARELAKLISASNAVREIGEITVGFPRTPTFRIQRGRLQGRRQGAEGRGRHLRRRHRPHQGGHGAAASPRGG